MPTLTNKEFMKVLSNACESEDLDAYLNKVLSNYSPYNLAFKFKEDLI